MLVKSSDALREIALAAKAENELISALISESRRDSRTLKVLTYIALIYLPAGLVAVSIITFACASSSNIPWTNLAN